MRGELGSDVGLHAPPHLDHQNPDPQVAVGDDHDGEDEVKENHGDGVGRAGGLSERAGVHPGVVLQRPHKQVRHDGDHRQEPDQHHVAEGVLVAVQLVVLEAVADVTVSVDGDAGDVEYGPDDAESHEESADLAVSIPQAPAVVKY